METMDFSELEKILKITQDDLDNFAQISQDVVPIEEEEEDIIDDVDLIDDVEFKEIKNDCEDDDPATFSDSYGIDSSDEEQEAPAIRVGKEIATEDHKIANEHKTKGNLLVREQKWAEAIPEYTLAINSYNKEPIYYANRAFCYLKTEQFKLAEADCTKAIRLDYKYIKAYLRRASARKEMNNLLGVCRDYQDIVFLEPNNTAIRTEFTNLRSQLGIQEPSVN